MPQMEGDWMRNDILHDILFSALGSAIALWVFGAIYARAGAQSPKVRRRLILCFYALCFGVIMGCGYAVFGAGNRWRVMQGLTPLMDKDSTALEISMPYEFVCSAPERRLGVIRPRDATGEFMLYRFPLGKFPKGGSFLKNPDGSYTSLPFVAEKH